MRGLTRVVASAAAMGLLAAGFAAAPPAQAADGIIIWADAVHAPVIEQLLPDGYQGTPVSVVVKRSSRVSRATDSSAAMPSLKLRPGASVPETVAAEYRL